MQRAVQKSFLSDGIDDIVKTAELGHFLRKGLHRITKTRYWPKIDAMLLTNGGIVLAVFNSGLPDIDEYLAGNLFGLELGQSVETKYQMCPEQTLISVAARRGISTLGTDMFVRSFSCVPCAYSCLIAGFKRIFYLNGNPGAAEFKELQSKEVGIFRVIL